MRSKLHVIWSSLNLIRLVSLFSSSAWSTGVIHSMTSKSFSLASNFMAAVLPQPEGPERISMEGCPFNALHRSQLQISFCFCRLIANSDSFRGSQASSSFDKLVSFFLLLKLLCVSDLSNRALSNSVVLLRFIEDLLTGSQSNDGTHQVLLLCEERAHEPVVRAVKKKILRILHMTYKKECNWSKNVAKFRLGQNDWNFTHIIWQKYLWKYF